jgi:hypothetical protein
VIDSELLANITPIAMVYGNERTIISIHRVKPNQLIKSLGGPHLVGLRGVVVILRWVLKPTYEPRINIPPN